MELFHLILIVFPAMSVYWIFYRFRHPKDPIHEGELSWHGSCVVLILAGIIWVATAKDLGIDEQGLYMTRSAHQDCLGPGCKYQPEELTVLRLRL